MEQFIMEYLGQILLAIALALVELARRKSKSDYEKQLAEQKRITDNQNQEHTLKLQSLQSENVQTNAQLDIIKEYATGVPKIQETWQSVLNTMSARRLEGDKDIALALREIAVTNRDNMKAIEGISNIIEIHTNAYGNLSKKVDDSLYTFVAAAKATHTAVDSQKEELALVSESMGKLATRLDDLITIDESHVLDEGTRHDILRKDNNEHKAELVAIKDALQTSNGILEKILKRMETNTQPIPLPTPEIWNEEKEQTAPLPPNPRDDESDNPLLNSA